MHMDSDTHGGQSGALDVQSSSLSHARSVPSDPAGELDDSNRAAPDAELLALVGRSHLQYLAGVPSESAARVFDFSLARLRIGHVLELLHELDPKCWAAHYKRAALSGPRAFCAWLRALGAPLPPLDQMKAEEPSNLLKKMRGRVLEMDKRKHFSQRRSKAKSDEAKVAAAAAESLHQRRVYRLPAARLVEQCIPSRLAAAAVDDGGGEEVCGVAAAHAAAVEEQPVTLERQHPHTHALTLDECFKNHMAQADAREQRQAVDMRSATGGAARKAARENAEDGKTLHGTNRSYKQQLALAAHAKCCASRYSNMEFFARRVGKLRRAKRAAYDAAKTKIFTVKVEDMRATKAVGPTGAARRAPITLQAPLPYT